MRERASGQTEAHACRISAGLVLVVGYGGDGHHIRGIAIAIAIERAGLAGSVKGEASSVITSGRYQVLPSIAHLLPCND